MTQKVMIGKKNHMKNTNFVTIILCSIISCVMWIMPLMGNQKLMEYANPYMLISSGFTIILPVAILSYYCAWIDHSYEMQNHKSH